MTAQRTTAPRIPAHIRRLGATKVTRCVGGDSFALAFKVVGSFEDEGPGNGTEIVAALRDHFGEDVEIKWDGSQCSSILLIPAA